MHLFHFVQKLLGLYRKSKIIFHEIFLLFWANDIEASNALWYPNMSRALFTLVTLQSRNRVWNLSQKFHFCGSKLYSHFFKFNFRAKEMDYQYLIYISIILRIC